MRPSVVGGVQERADAFVTRCAESGDGGLDVYVCLYARRWLLLLTPQGLPPLLRTRLCITPPLPSLWPPLRRARRRHKVNARALLLSHHQKSVSFLHSSSSDLTNLSYR